MRMALLILAVMAGLQAGPAAEPSKPLHPKFPVIDGLYRMTEDWALTLDQKHNRRIEDGSLVIWRPGFTIWTKVWGSKDGETPEQTLKGLKDGISPKATEVKEEQEGGVLRVSYRLDEESEDKRRPAFHGFAVGSDSHVQISIYFNDEKEAAKAVQIFKSLTPVDAKKAKGKTAAPAAPAVPEKPAPK